MAKQLINTGTTANDNTGDNLRVAGKKLNENFNEIYNAFGDGATLLSTDIDLSGNRILFANKVDTADELDSISPVVNAGCIIYVNAESSLYYAANGVWRELLTDTSDGINNNYVNPLSPVAYGGNLTDLGIDDGLAGQILTTNGDRTFSFADPESLGANATQLNGQGPAFYLNFNNFTNTPTTLAGYGIVDAATSTQGALANTAIQPADLANVATSGSYNDLTNLPSIPTDVNDLTDISNSLVEDIAELSDNQNLLFSGNYNDLSNLPFIPSDIADLTDSTSSIPRDVSELTDNLNEIPRSGIDFDPVGTDNSTPVTVTSMSGLDYIQINDQEINLSVIEASTDIAGLSSVALSGSYNDLTNKPTSFTNFSSLSFSLGATVNEFSTDTALSGNSNNAVPTENAVKTYVDNNIPTDLTDLGISDGTIGQILTTNGAGVFSFQDATSIGNFTFASSIIDTDDSSTINITPSIIANSDLTVENDLVVRNNLTVDTLTVAGTIATNGAGSPELFSEDNILLTASTRVEVTQSPLKLASFTNTERDALTPEFGDTIYNTETGKVQAYVEDTGDSTNGWVDLH